MLSLRCWCFVSKCQQMFYGFIALLLRQVWHITQTGFGRQLSFETNPGRKRLGVYAWHLHATSANRIRRSHWKDKSRCTKVWLCSYLGDHSGRWSGMHYVRISPQSGLSGCRKHIQWETLSVLHPQISRKRVLGARHLFPLNVGGNPFLACLFSFASWLSSYIS